MRCLFTIHCLLFGVICQKTAFTRADRCRNVRSEGQQ